MTLLYGPDGHPIVTTSKALALREGTVDVELLGEEIAKRVRSQATTLTQVWDPKRGKPKPTPVTFETLRMMANRNEWVRAIIKTRKNQIGRVPWSIQPRDEDDDSASTKKMCEAMEKLLRRPSLHGSRPHSRSWRQFIGEVLEDILVLDAGCIEKERNGAGWIVAMYPVDGATIRPNLDDRGGYPDDAYVQIVDGQVTARFGMEDLVYIMDNPQTDVRYAGFGYSPLEHLIVSVTAELYASKYNSSYFQQGSVPEGMINLGEDAAPEDVDAFRLYWTDEIMGKPWALPIVAGKGVEWQPWRSSNKDMEFMSYQQWLLKKLCAVYQIPPQEVGELEDVNRSTAAEQADTNQSKSIEPILTLIEDYFEVEVIGEHGQGLGDYVKFAFDLETDDAAAELQKFQVLVDAGAATRNEMREAVGLEPGEEEGLDLYLVAGQLQGLPTQQDIDTLGAKAQQDHQDQQAQMQGGVESNMPWQHADPSDPDVASAKLDHAAQGGATAADHIGIAKAFEDRNPAMSARTESLEALFERERERLIDGLQDILGVDLALPGE